VRAPLADIIDTSAAALPIVVLDHNPTTIPEYTGGVDLVLFGHTHRGQIFPASLITRLMYEIDHGHMHRHGTHFIVTQGAHTVLTPMRVGTHSEIANVLVR
jgi:predicted MPP superfamily phosphohydrolase